MNTVEYEVIANYPDSLFDIGDIIIVYEWSCMAYLTPDGKYDLRDFPALFKRID